MPDKLTKLSMLGRSMTLPAESNDDMGGVVGKEGRLIPRNAQKGKSIAVFTSGGDSQGMNSALRAVVRMGLYLGAKVYFIKEGYQGMVDGGDNIVEANWLSVSGIIQKGGTVIGSARCLAFKERAGRLKAATNLVKRRITNLVVIGGDGSLTGANLFRKEWPSLLEDLVTQGEILAEEKDQCSHLNIVGMVGSIDNDFCGTDMTLGADTALHRIVEAIDAIRPTAASHQRTFILEVMGRHCGYLALVAGLTSEADFVFIPEWPPAADWPEKMCNKLKQERDMGQRLNIIIVSEGAIDRDGNPISADVVREHCVNTLGHDARVTVLGHVQRGGNPSAFDRILGCRWGAEAVLALFDATPESEPMVISLYGNQVVRVPLMACVEKTKAVTQAMADKNWKLAVDLRGRSFHRNLETFKMLTKLRPPIKRASSEKEPCFKFGIIHIGAPACGMNAAVRSFVRNCIYHGHSILAIQNGIDGLLEGEIRTLDWTDVNGWCGDGGAHLGTKRTIPDNKIGEVAEKLGQLNLHGLVVIGGFEGFQALVQMSEARDQFKQFCIPIVMLPCTISNNVPGSEFSLGADTALNEITEICDRIRQSAMGSKNRVFIIETMGGYCGYLATLAGLAGGADAAYIWEEKFRAIDLLSDIEILKKKMDDGVQRGLILRNEMANENYTTEFINQIFSEEGFGHFTARMNVLGHMQQGGSPSPYDRSLGTKLAAKACEWLMVNASANLQPDGSVSTNDPETACLLGCVRHAYMMTPIRNLKPLTNFKNRLPCIQWWLKLRPLLRILAKHGDTYEEQSFAVTANEILTDRNVGL